MEMDTIRTAGVLCQRLDLLATQAGPGHTSHSLVPIRFYDLATTFLTYVVVLTSFFTLFFITSARHHRRFRGLAGTRGVSETVLGETRTHVDFVTRSGIPRK